MGRLDVLSERTVKQESRGYFEIKTRVKVPKTEMSREAAVHSGSMQVPERLDSILYVLVWTVGCPHYGVEGGASFWRWIDQDC